MKNPVFHFWLLAAWMTIMLPSGASKVAFAVDTPADTKANSQAITSAQTWNFSVYLDDKPIGYHRFTLGEQGADKARELKSEARFNVKFLRISLYSYQHDARERWQGDCLSVLKASTDDGGKKSNVDAQRKGDQLDVSATGRQKQNLSGCVMTFAYWNPLMLRQSRLLNPQTGEYEAVKISEVGVEQIKLRGQAVAATHYRISGPKNPVEIWYSPQGEWLALESAVDGRTLRYVLQ